MMNKGLLFYVLQLVIFAIHIDMPDAFVSVQKFNSAVLIPHFDPAGIIEFDAGSLGNAD